MGPQEQPMPEEGAPAPEQGQDPKQGMSQDQAEQVAKGISEKAVSLLEGMQEIGFVLEKLGTQPEALEQLAGQFKAFMQTLQGILGGGEAAPEEGPQKEDANQPVDENSAGKGVPYEQGQAMSGKNKAVPMVG
jgi:DNA anti-recombination protein RmuC